MTLRDILQNKPLMTKIVWLGYIASIVLMAIGLWYIIQSLI